MNEHEIHCGCCDNHGFIGDGFEWSEVDPSPWAVIKCDKCGAELMFDMACYIDFDAVYDYEDDWTEVD